MNNYSIHNSKVVQPHKDIFMRSHVNELVNEVKSNIENGTECILIDFSNIENIDIIGFGILRMVQKISITNNVEIKLFNVKPNVHKVIENSCLILDIHNGGEEKSLIHEEIALIA